MTDETPNGAKKPPAEFWIWLAISGLFAVFMAVALLAPPVISPSRIDSDARLQDRVR